MSARTGNSRVVLASFETEDGLRCVDLFRRPDGTFGYEEFRRDPEDQGIWTPVRHASGLTYLSMEDAHRAAIDAVPWL